jgi:hypothetical protein
LTLVREFRSAAFLSKDESLTCTGDLASMQIVSDEERARFEVLLEQVRDQVGAIAEGHGAVHTELQAFRREVGERFSGVEARLDRVEAHLVNGHRTPSKRSPSKRPKKKS